MELNEYLARATAHESRQASMRNEAAIAVTSKLIQSLQFRVWIYFLYPPIPRYQKGLESVRLCDVHDSNVRIPQPRRFVIQAFLRQNPSFQDVAAWMSLWKLPCCQLLPMQFTGSVFTGSQPNIGGTLSFLHWSVCGQFHVRLS